MPDEPEEVVDTLEGKVVELLNGIDDVVDDLGEVEVDGTKQSEDLIPGITVGCGSSWGGIEAAIIVDASLGLFGWEIPEGETGLEDKDVGGDCLRHSF